MYLISIKTSVVCIPCIHAAIHKKPFGRLNDIVRLSIAFRKKQSEFFYLLVESRNKSPWFRNVVWNIELSAFIFRNISQPKVILQNSWKLVLFYFELCMHRKRKLPYENVLFIYFIVTNIFIKIKNKCYQRIELSLRKVSPHL